MRGINKNIILGTVVTEVFGKELEKTVFCNFKVATNRTHFQQKTQQDVEETEYHRIIVYNERAALCIQKVHKGQKVYIEGYSKTRKWTDNQGIEREVTEVVCEKIEFIERGNEHEYGIEHRMEEADPFNNETYNVNRSPFPAHNNKQQKRYSHRQDRSPYQERDQYQGHNQNQSRSPYQGRDQHQDRNQYQGRDQNQGRNQYQGRDQNQGRNQYQGRDQNQGRNQYQGQQQNSRSWPKQHTHTQEAYADQQHGQYFNDQNFDQGGQTGYPSKKGWNPNNR